ncbi:MAG: VC0807 family protein [Pseudobdellovibrionaceae bacterium]
MSQPKQENALINLAFNIVIPVLILNKGSQKLGAAYALLIALAFPLAFGLFDLYKKRKWNAFSILGFTNVLVTGSLAVAGLGGIWFSIKEAFFPFLIGIFVWYSSLREKPLVQTFLLNPHTMNIETIEERLKSNQKQGEFLKHLQFSTKLLACSFFLSAALNFFLAERIFTPLAESLDSEAKSVALNQQIAQMTTWSSVVIVIPSMVFLIAILLHLLKGIRQLTGLQTDEILKG